MNDGHSALVVHTTHSWDKGLNYSHHPFNFRGFIPWAILLTSRTYQRYSGRRGPWESSPWYFWPLTNFVALLFCLLAAFVNRRNCSHFPIKPSSSRGDHQSWIEDCGRNLCQDNTNFPQKSIFDWLPRCQKRDLKMRNSVIQANRKLIFKLQMFATGAWNIFCESHNPK